MVLRVRFTLTRFRTNTFYKCSSLAIELLALCLYNCINHLRIQGRLEELFRCKSALLKHEQPHLNSVRQVGKINLSTEE